jgi:alcohol dehydrogenase
VKTPAAVLRSTAVPPDFAGALDVADVELVDPGPGEVLLRIEAAGVCHSDLSVVDGSRPRPMPMVLGHEAAGIVEALGPGVVGVEPGDHVVCTFVPACGTCVACASGRSALCPSAQEANRAGTLVTGSRPFRDGEVALHHHLGVSAFSAWSVVSVRSLVRIPPDVPAPVAAVFGCAVLTGVGAVLNTAGVAAGDTVAVFGLGGVGLSAVMGAAVAGASRIVAVDRNPDKLALAAELGATDGVRAGDGAPAIRELTAGGVNWAFEAVGSARVLAECYAATAPGGTTVSVGLPHPDQRLELPAVSLVAEEKSIRGSYMGSAVPQRDIPRLLGLYRAGKLPVDRLVTRRSLGLADLPGAFAALADATEVRQIIEPHRPAG